MTLTAVLLAIGVLLGGALGALLTGRNNRVCLALSSLTAIVGCAIGLAGAIGGLQTSDVLARQWAWSVPVGELHVGLDPLSSFFLLCIFLVSGLGALYGAGYMRAEASQRSVAPACAFYLVLTASMAAVVVARDGVLFLMAWEVMSLSSYFLVVSDHEREEVRRAGLTYLVASHVGVVLLLVLLGLLSRGSGRFDFAWFAAVGPPEGLAGLCFVLALLGFGTKAGFWPLHVWLPEAHPAAPSHVSALMSGVMIKLGIYGLIRALDFLGPPPEWWGVLLILLGTVTGVAGVLLALVQHDLKRLLAYSSIENVGIVVLGLGVGLLGRSLGLTSLSVLGFLGALLHVLNHGLFKGLLFQAAGAVIRGAGTRQIEALGGLLKRMPATGALFLLGSVAICGLPPLNGFVSELLIFVGALTESGEAPLRESVALLLAVGALALISGLAAACFVKALGIVFLGEPRSESAARAREVGPLLVTPMAIGGALCLLIGVFPEPVLRLILPVATQLAALTGPPPQEIFAAARAITQVAGTLLGLMALFALLRLFLLRGREVRAAPTWGCGYAQPTARMQYTAASFAQPLVTPLRPMLTRSVEGEEIVELFPRAARYEEHLSDPAAERLLFPALRGVVLALGWVRVLQRGRVQVYLAYILATLVLLLTWQLASLPGGR